MKMTDRTFWTTAAIVVAAMLLDWMGVRYADLVESIRGIARGGENPLVGWMILGLCIFTVVKTIQALTR